MATSKSIAKPAGEIGLFADRVAAVADRAAEMHRDQLRQYVAGVRRLAENGGAMPAEEADELLATAKALGISPERLGYDVEVLVNAANLSRQIDAARARNDAQREPLPRLEAAARDAEAGCLKVRQEYAARLQAAEAAVREARAARDAVARLRDEPTEHWERKRRRLRDLSPHLYAELDEGEFRRVMARRPAAILAGG